MTATTRSPRLQAALDALAAAMEDLDPVVRLMTANELLKAGGVHSDAPAQARELYKALFKLTESVADHRLERLVSALEVGGPELRQALVLRARDAVTGDAPRADMWAALGDLADAVVE